MLAERAGFEGEKHREKGPVGHHFPPFGHLPRRPAEDTSPSEDEERRVLRAAVVKALQEGRDEDARKLLALLP